MNVLDWILLVLVAAYALSGYWQGFVTGAFATVGLLAGGIFGIWLAPTVLGNADPGTWVTMMALFIVILTASLGQAVLQFLGSRIRDRIKWQPIRSVDAIGGAVLSAAAVLLVAWALGVAVSGSPMGGITPLVRESTVLGKVNRVMPGGSTKLLEAFNNVVGSTFFPRYLEPFAPERIVDVPGVPKDIVTRHGVQAAQASVLKIHGSNACGRGIEGSGFVYAPDRLMTNAHVVAGVTDPEIITPSGTLSAEVVHYDSQLDIAVLSFDDAALKPLRFDERPATAKQGVAVLGYPQDGPYDARPGRVRSNQRLRSPDIYGNGSVIREVLSLRTTVRPGNSGGPVVGADGKVLGLVFAASVSDSETGYALTVDQVSEAAAAGRQAVSPVGTGGCA